MKNPLNCEKVKGSPLLLDYDRKEIGPKVEVKSMQTQSKIMKWAAAKCPSVKLKIMGESVPSLLNSGSIVSLMWQDHFNRYFRLPLGPAEGSIADIHHMFDLTSASGGAIPLSRYVELDMAFLGLQVPRVRFLITQNPNKVLDPEHKTRFPRIMGWNVVKLAYQEFLKKYDIDVFEDFECLDGVNHLLFSQLCIYYCADVVPAVVNEIQDDDGLVYTEEITKNKRGKIIDKKHQNFISSADRQVGTVTIGTDNQPICVPGSATITVLGKLSKLVAKGSYMVELAAHNSLPSSVVVIVVM